MTKREINEGKGVRSHHKNFLLNFTRNCRNQINSLKLIWTEMSVYNFCVDETYLLFLLRRQYLQYFKNKLKFLHGFGIFQKKISEDNQYTWVKLSFTNCYLRAQITPLRDQSGPEITSFNNKRYSSIHGIILINLIYTSCAPKPW